MSFTTETKFGDGNPSVTQPMTPTLTKVKSFDFSCMASKKVCICDFCRSLTVKSVAIPDVWTDPDTGLSSKQTFCTRGCCDRWRKMKNPFHSAPNYHEQTAPEPSPLASPRSYLPSTPTTNDTLSGRSGNLIKTKSEQTLKREWSTLSVTRSLS